MPSLYHWHRGCLFDLRFSQLRLFLEKAYVATVMHTFLGHEGIYISWCSVGAALEKHPEISPAGAECCDQWSDIQHMIAYSYLGHYELAPNLFPVWVLKAINGMRCLKENLTHQESHLQTLLVWLMGIWNWALVVAALSMWKSTLSRYWPHFISHHCQEGGKTILFSGSPTLNCVV